MLGFIPPILTIMIGAALCFLNPIAGVPTVLFGVIWLFTKTTFFSAGVILRNLKVIIPVVLIIAAVLYAKQQGLI